MRFSARIIVLIVFVMIVICSLLLALNTQSKFLVKETVVAYQDGLLLANSLDSSRQTQVQFQRQVQEWKNVLIRGGNLELQERHWLAFQAREKDVKEGLSALAKELNTEQMQRVADMVVNQQVEHKILGEKYREALKPYLGKPLTPIDIVNIDTSIRGIDRSMSSGMDGIIEEVHQLVEQEFESKLKQVKTQSNDNEMMILVITLILGLFMIGMLVAMTMSLFKMLGADPEDAAEATARIATGDLTERLEVKDPKSLYGSLAVMQLKLRNISLAIQASLLELKSKAVTLKDYEDRKGVLYEIKLLQVAIDRLKIDREK